MKEENCIFCKIINKEIPKDFSYEDENFVAFLDINPVTEGHTLLIPKKHFRWFIDLPDDLYTEMFKIAKKLAQKLKEEHKADFVRLDIIGKDVHHAHVHLIPHMMTDGKIQA